MWLATKTRPNSFKGLTSYLFVYRGLLLPEDGEEEGSAYSSYIKIRAYGEVHGDCVFKPTREMISAHRPVRPINATTVPNISLGQQPTKRSGLPVCTKPMR